MPDDPGKDASGKMFRLGDAGESVEGVTTDVSGKGSVTVH
jgi:hypothetical protein